MGSRKKTKTRKKGKPPTEPAQPRPRRPSGAVAGAGEISGRPTEVRVTYHAEPPSPDIPRKIHPRRPLPSVPDHTLEA